MGSYYVDCYVPTRIDYRVYSHNQNGENIYGTAMKNGYNDLALSTIFPEDATQPYTYGIEGNGVMTIYYPRLRVIWEEVVPVTTQILYGR